MQVMNTGINYNFTGRIIKRIVKNGKTKESVYYTNDEQDKRILSSINKFSPLLLTLPQKMDDEFVAEFDLLISDITKEKIQPTKRKFLRNPQNNMTYLDMGEKKKEVHYSFYI